MLKYLLLPFIAPIAILWLVVGMFVFLLPVLLLGLSLAAIGEGDKGEEIIDWASQVWGFEKAPWTWLRGER